MACKPGRFVPVVHPQTGRLLFRYDPERDLIELVQRGERTLIDLRDYQRTALAETTVDGVANQPPRARRSD